MIDPARLKISRIAFVLLLAAGLAPGAWAQRAVTLTSTNEGDHGNIERIGTVARLDGVFGGPSPLQGGPSGSPAPIAEVFPGLGGDHAPLPSAPSAIPEPATLALLLPFALLGRRRMPRRIT